MLKVPGRTLCWLALLMPLPGCFDPLFQPQGNDASVQTEPASFAQRAGRRAYDGAPPVIPHPPLGASCAVCHNETGKEVSGLGFAPPNPHSSGLAAGRVENCRQCHVFQKSKELFAESDFAGLMQTYERGERAYPAAPPVIPHSLLMRQNCRACHAGPASRPEIRCTHPERTNCTQCHLSHGASGSPPDGTLRDVRVLSTGDVLNHSRAEFHVVTQR